MIQTLKHTIQFKQTDSFIERERVINNELLKAMDTLRQRGMYPLSHEILNKNESGATVLISYKV